jgi:hypothetical protein
MSLDTDLDPPSAAQPKAKTNQYFGLNLFGRLATFVCAYAGSASMCVCSCFPPFLFLVHRWFQRLFYPLHVPSCFLHTPGLGPCLDPTRCLLCAWSPCHPGASLFLVLLFFDTHNFCEIVSLSNLYAPFTCRPEWLHQSSLSISPPYCLVSTATNMLKPKSLMCRDVYTGFFLLVLFCREGLWFLYPSMCSLPRRTTTTFVS